MYGTQNMSGYFDKKAVYKVKFEDNRMYIIGGTEKEPSKEVWEWVE